MPHDPFFCHILYKDGGQCRLYWSLISLRSEIPSPMDQRIYRYVNYFYEARSPLFRPKFHYYEFQLLSLVQGQNLVKVYGFSPHKPKLFGQCWRRLTNLRYLTCKVALWICCKRLDHMENCFCWSCPSSCMRSCSLH